MAEPKHAQYQVAVVGGGPAGLVTAITAAREGVESILLVEKKRQWGKPVQCAEYVPKLIAQVIEIPAEAVANRIEFLSLYLEGKLIGLVRAPGFILHREVLERELAREAVELGVECLRPARAAQVRKDGLVLLIGTARATVRAEIIVGADGPRSMVRKRMDQPPLALARGIQYALPVCERSEIAEVHFSPRYGAGYAWYFPKGELANVGLALDPGRQKTLRPLLDEFVARLWKSGRIADARPRRRSGGFIPISGPGATAVRDHMILVGDAAGQTNPLTGAGIYAAAACGRFAGEAIAQAARKRDISLLRTYEESWRDLFGRFLSDAAVARTRLAAAEARNYDAVLRKSWRIIKRNSR